MRLHIGLDLGQSQDYSALALIEETDILTVRYLHRWPLRTKYPAIVNDVREMMEGFPERFDSPILAIDQTGVGAPVVDLFRETFENRYILRPVQITGGSSVSHDSGVVYVPKRDLVSVVSVALQTEKLVIGRKLEHASTLRQELENFKVMIGPSGHDTYGAGEEWRVNSHDDLVLAVALALWSAKSRRVTEITFA